MRGRLHTRRVESSILDRVGVSVQGLPEEALVAVGLGSATRRRLVRSEARLPVDQVVQILVQIPGLELRGDDDVVALLRHRTHMETDGRRVDGALARLRNSGIAEARAQLADDLPAVAHLDGHQLVGCATLTVPSGWGACLFDEQGTGKTVTTMAAYDVLRQRLESDILLVVAPKSMIGEWEAEFGRFYGPRYQVAVVEGTATERTKALYSRADVYVLNYEAVARHERELRTLLGGCSAVIAIDESFFVKNPQAARTQAILGLRLLCDRAWVLCGTPAPNHPVDVVTQFDIVDLGRTFGGLDVPKDRVEASGSVQRRLATAAWSRSRKDDVLDLPSRRFHDVLVAMSPVQAQLYEATAQDLVRELEGLTDSQFAKRRTHFLQRRAALLQLASNPASLVPDYKEEPNKLRIVEHQVRELIAAGEKVVLWSFYRKNIQALRRLFDDLGTVVIDGSVEGDDRRTAVRGFQEDQSVQLFIGNPAAAGAGLTLHAARHAVYESFSNQAAHFLQSLDRIHRRGQQREVSYRMVLSEGTLEIPEYQRLIDKASGQADLLGDANFSGLDRSTLWADLTHHSRQ